MNGSVDADLMVQLKQILRRDLKLGPGANIADDMPLVGGDMDLDSLDVLLLVSSVEKGFGIKIPNEAVGRAMFSNVTTLATFIQDNRDKLATNAATNGTAVVPAAEIDWLARLPHGPEFRFLTKVIEVVPGERAVGQWKVDGSEAFFKGHFPNRPIVPGVLIIESLAQIAGIAMGGHENHQGGMLVQSDVRFDAPVVPPATIDVSAVSKRQVANMRLCDVTASVNGKTVAHGTVAIHVGVSLS
jgi:3-hydroxyacyl-[acyl-carrier-protein] dehydratase